MSDCTSNNKISVIITQNITGLPNGFERWYTEPITATYPDMDLHELSNYFGPTDDSLTFYAVYEGRVVGERNTEYLSSFLNRMAPEHFAKFETSLKHLVPFTKFAVKQIHEYLKLHSTNVNVCAHFRGLAVDELLRGLGIALSMCIETTKFLKDRGFEYIFVECTSAYSRRIMVKLGGVLLGSMSYSTYSKENGLPEIDPVHEFYGVYVIKISDCALAFN